MGSSELRRRITTVESASKIVDALRIVAAARIRSSSHAALRTRPFAEELQRVMSKLITHITARNIDLPPVAAAFYPTLSDLHGPLLADPTVQRALMNRLYLTLMSGSDSGVVLLCVVTSDKRFCGGYNKDVLTKAVRRIAELEKVGKKVELVLLGRVGRLYFKRHYPHIPVRSAFDSARAQHAETTSTELSHVLLSEFIAGDVQRVEVVYTRFISLICSAPSTRTLLPLTPTGLESVGDEIFQLLITTHQGKLTAKRVIEMPTPDGQSMGVDLYDISDEQAVHLLNSMLPMYVTSQLIRIVREAIASEQAARLTAMTTASDNARELVVSLKRRYNKERQAKITNEIIELTTNV